jgi:hypothetical protein
MNIWRIYTQLAEREVQLSAKKNINEGLQIYMPATMRCCEAVILPR